MNRRRFLVAGTVTTVGALAGCLGDDDADDGTGATDGYGSEPETEPAERTIDTDAYETLEHDGVDVPLAPLEDVYYWYLRREARAVDTRGASSFEDARITGAALSPAPDGRDADDPVAEWPTDDRIVTYCVCPHAMAVQRAAALIDDGHENVYALDDGFNEWVDAGYPVEGDEVDDTDLDLPAYHVQGESDPAYEGEYVDVRTVDGDQRERSVVDADGTYELTLHFTGLEEESVLEVDAPDYTTEVTLEELTSETVTPP
ncbi:rhodanese-like domain-containing protein [Natronolimnohabitans innermongolicus]|uniref:Rhodanese domain-containing protein n=1 Tax=Natronolimnohabitans innermongolicus JCM 12255 TaxID=1227499 RepID=L9X2N4_9EURY|nr:rhodanese-like domain-containing protein [Natronolimnohabitans innermongolicus]ELY54858.1 hypothetical protein C493_12177 [Natronolimnohabitans innermongolicus JCM 12255]